MRRDFSATAALIETVDEMIDLLRNEPSGETRQNLSVELNKQQRIDELIEFLPFELDEDDLLGLLAEYANNVPVAMDGSDVEEFTSDISDAWSEYQQIAFEEHGISSPLDKIRVALFGKNSEKFAWALPLHMHKRIGQIMQ